MAHPQCVPRQRRMSVRRGRMQDAVRRMVQARRLSSGYAMATNDKAPRGAQRKEETQS